MSHEELISAIARDLGDALARGRVSPEEARAAVRALAQKDRGPAHSEQISFGSYGPYNPGRSPDGVRVSPDRYLVVPISGGISPTGGTGAPVPASIPFTDGDARILGWSGWALDLTAGAFASGTLELASIQVQMRLGSKENLVTDGEDPAYANFATLFNNSAGYAPLDFCVKSTQRLHFNFLNLQPAVGGHVIIPVLTLYAQDLGPRLNPTGGEE